MKVAKRTAWVLGIAAAVIVLVVVFRNRGEGDMLTLRFVDGMGRPVRTDTGIRELRFYPVLSSATWLPWWLKGSEKKSWHVTAPDGVLRVRRIVARDRGYELKCSSGREFFILGYLPSTNGHSSITKALGLPLSPIDIAPEQTEVVIQVP